MHKKPTVNLNHSKWNYNMQTNGQIKLKIENRRIFEQ